MQNIFDAIRGIYNNQATQVDVKGATAVGGRLQVQSDLTETKAKVLPFTFQNVVTTAGAGTEFPVGAYKELTVDIYGTATASDVKFYQKSAAGVKRPLQGMNLADWSTGVNTTGKDQTWSFVITGLDSVIMEVASISGGNISVKGNAVT